MGVTGLWSILSELCNREPLMYLSGKRVAVDLSGWVVQATLCKPLSTSKNPHLRNLFFRVSCLLQNGVRPVFVIEGKPPALKEVAFSKRNHVGNRETKNNLSRSNFDRILRQCQDLLDCLGVPCIKSSGEAEALCAFLCLNGIVDGVITEDNDAFLYGADVVFRDFSIDPKDAHVNVYDLKSCKNKLQLDRRKLVALALLLGCDYSKGVPGVGKEAALKFLSELKETDLLQRFQEWKTLDESELFPGYLGKKVKKLSHCNRCDHLGSSTAHKKTGCELCNSTITCYLNSEVTCPCPWHISSKISLKQKAELKIYSAAKEITDFPNSEVINEYLYYSDQVPDSEALLWKCPNLQNFQEKAFNYLGWTLKNSLDKCLPLITSWQLYSLCSPNVSNQMIFEPIKIVKERVVKGEDCLEILWELKDIESNTDLSSENLCTVEHLKLFAKAYPNITNAFFAAKTEEKEAKTKLKAEQQQKRKRAVKDQKDTRKVMQETPVVPSNNFKSHVINSPPLILNSPSSESFDSFTNIPLAARVIALSENLYQRHIKELKVNEESTENPNKICVESSKIEETNFPLTRKDVSKGDDSFPVTIPYSCVDTDSFQNNIHVRFSDSDDSFNVFLSQNKELFLSGNKRNLGSSPLVLKSPSSDSFDSFTNIPLSVRVIALSEKISQKHIKDLNIKQTIMENPGEICVESSKIEQMKFPITKKDVSKGDDSFSKTEPHSCVDTDSFQTNSHFCFSDSDDSFNVFLSQNKELFLSGSKRNLSCQRFNDMPERILSTRTMNLKLHDSENISSNFSCKSEQKLLSGVNFVNKKDYKNKRGVNASDGSSLCHSVCGKQIISDKNLDFNNQCIKTDLLSLKVNTHASNEESTKEEVFCQCKKTNESSIDNLMLQIQEPYLIDKPSSVLVNDGSLYQNQFSPEMSDLQCRISKMQIGDNVLAVDNLVSKPCDKSYVSPEQLYVLNRPNIFCKTPGSFISSTPNIRLKRLKSKDVSMCFEKSKLLDTPKFALYSPVIFDSSNDSSLSKVTSPVQMI